LARGEAEQVVSLLREAAEAQGAARESELCLLHAGAAAEEAPPAGLMHPEVGGFRPHDLEFVAAFDVDARKVGRPLEEAVFAKPNCALVFQPTLPASGCPITEH